jgi:hypothetical protein
MFMTLSEIRSRVLKEVQDESLEVFDNSTVDDLINDGLRQISEQSAAFTYRNVFIIESGDLIPDANTYMLPDDFIRMDQIKLNDVPLKIITTTDSYIFDETDYDNYATILNDEVEFKSDLSVGDEIKMYYRRSHPTLTDDTDTLIREMNGHEQMLIDYCAYRIHAINGDIQLSEKYGQRYGGSLQNFKIRTNANTNFGISFKRISTKSFWGNRNVR